MLSSIILAAGKGTRMRSVLPKVLQTLGCRPLLHHVVVTAQSLSLRQTIVVAGFGIDAVKASCAKMSISWAEQAQQLGTGHAVAQAIDMIRDNETALILYGDVPLIHAVTLQRLVDLVDDLNPIALLTIDLDNPKGYGRVVRNKASKILSIIEEKDATEQQKTITEVNTGIMAVKGLKLRQWLANLKNHNAQGEYYLTDIIAMAVDDGFMVQSTQAMNEMEVLGVNDKVQLAGLERMLQEENVAQLLKAGVTVLDPTRCDIRGTVDVGMDVSIDINVVMSGKVVLGNNVSIGAGCILTNVVLGDGVTLLPYSVLEECVIGTDSKVGPFARVRPGTVTQDHAHIGNFVELKNAQVGSGAKINHLSYIGDATVGAKANIGAGTITCNYDGVNKYRTIIGEGAFVGSNSALVAPITIGAGATIGAGSVVTKDAPDDKLTLSRAKQITIDSWQRPTKNSCKTES
jgi:bifunctional UDP-N-acetylglucosamine pyrophosphorylase/glucosamine-1-phosphate N-acetyltransferase